MPSEMYHLALARAAQLKTRMFGYLAQALSRVLSQVTMLASE